MTDDADAKLAAKRERHREEQRRYAARNPAKERKRKREAQREYLVAHRNEINKRARERWQRLKAKGVVRSTPEVRAQARVYRELNHERLLERKRQYRLINRDEINAGSRAHYQRNREAILARLRAVSASKRSIQQATFSPEILMKAVYAAIPPALPKFIRDEVAGEMMLAVLEGTLLMDNIRRSVTEQLRRYNKVYDTFKVLSLDAPVAGTEELRRIDMLTDRDSVFAL